MRQIDVTIDTLFDPDNVELALMLLPSEAWKSVDKPSIMRREDETYVTGDPFFDELEEALSQGEDIHGLLTRLQLTT
mgnify:FL=1